MLKNHIKTHRENHTGKIYKIMYIQTRLMPIPKKTLREKTLREKTSEKHIRKKTSGKKQLTFVPKISTISERVCVSKLS